MSREFENNTTTRKKTAVIASLLAILLIIIATIVVCRNFYPQYISLPTEDLCGDMCHDDSGEWYVDEESAGKGIVLYGPYMYLEKGDYTVEVDYECTRDNYMDVNANGYAEYLLAGDVPLSHLSTHKTFTFRLKEDVDDLEIRVGYEGSGFLKINGITLYKNANDIRRTAFLLIVGILVALGCYLKWDAISANRERIAWILLTAVLATAPMLVEGFCYGHDGRFHLLRIEGIAQGLLNGQFPVRMQSLWMEGYGYPVSIYYGDILLYLPAVLRIIGFSVSAAYKIYVFLINFGTVVIAQLCFERITGDRKAACIGASAYTFAMYRLVNMYVRTALGEYTAQMFLPVILLAVCNIYMRKLEEEGSEKDSVKNALLLALGMTGLIQTHMISVAMVCMLLVILAIVLYRKTFTKRTMFTYLRAVIMTLGINMFFIVPFVDYYINVSVRVMHEGEDELVKVIEHKGAYIGQYFMLYQKATGGAKYNVSDRMGLTPGVVLMLALIIAVYVCLKNKDRLLRILTTMSALTLFMASSAFPWNDIINHVPLMGWIYHIQFPFRFLSLAQVFLALLLCRLLALYADRMKEWMYPAVAVVIMAVAFQQSTAMMQERPYLMVYDAAQIDSFSVGNGEYIREDTDEELFDGEIYSNDVVSLGNYQKDGTHAEFWCETGTSGDAWVELPIMNYKGYKAKDRYGNTLETEDGNNNVLRILLPQEYSGLVTVDYVIPGSYRMADFCSLMCICGLAVVGRYRSIKKKKQSSGQV